VDDLGRRRRDQPDRVLLVGVGNGETVYFWPMWLVVPGGILFAVSVGVSAIRNAK
jgi:hypothetical protein